MLFAPNTTFTNTINNRDMKLTPEQIKALPDLWGGIRKKAVIVKACITPWYNQSKTKN